LSESDESGTNFFIALICKKTLTAKTLTAIMYGLIINKSLLVRLLRHYRHQRATRHIDYALFTHY